MHYFFTHMNFGLLDFFKNRKTISCVIELYLEILHLHNYPLASFSLFHEGLSVQEPIFTNFILRKFPKSIIYCDEEPLLKKFFSLTSFNMNQVKSKCQFSTRLQFFSPQSQILELVRL